MPDNISTGTFTQHHNPQIGDGLEGLGAFVADLTERGQAMAYEEIHNVVGSGNFVASLSKAVLAGKDVAAIDLFRVSDGRIVEHWDVVEEITPEETWVNRGNSDARPDPLRTRSQYLSRAYTVSLLAWRACP